MQAEAVIVSASPSRVRLRLLGQRGGRAQFERALARLRRLTSVVSASANPTTGTLLIFYHGTLDDLTNAIEAEGVLSIRQDRDDLPHRMDEAAIMGGLALAAAFAGLGLLQLRRQHALPPALTLFWYAGTLAAKLLSARADSPRNR